MVDGNDNNDSYRCTRISGNARSRHFLRTKSDRCQSGDEDPESRKRPSTGCILSLSKQGGYRGTDGKVVPVKDSKKLSNNACGQGLHVPLIVVELALQQQPQHLAIIVLQFLLVTCDRDAIVYWGGI